MNTIYLAEPGQQPATYTEAQVQALRASGRIVPQTLYWHEGMPEWRPVEEFFQAGTPPLAAAPQKRWAKDPATLTRVLRVLFFILLGMAALSAGMSGLSLATGRAAQTEIESFSLLDFIELGTALLYLGFYVTSVVIFCMWVHRANRNARALGSAAMRFTPGWSVGWFFIPIMNLWKPMQAMREIWHISENPHQDPPEETPPQVGTWWTLWLVTNFLGQLSLRYSLRATTGNDYMVAEVISLISDFVEIGLCLVAAQLVQSIYLMQKAHVEGA
jgi:hypothetical protein